MIRDNNSNNNNETNTIAILQYNLHQSQPRIDSILNHLSSSKYTILILQEQPWSLRNKTSPTHPTWNHPKYHRHDTEADDLVEGMLQLGMQLIIPPGTITYSKSGTAIDLVWGNEQAANDIIKCQIAEKNDHGSDHFPIETILNLRPYAKPSQKPPF